MSPNGSTRRREAKRSHASASLDSIVSTEERTFTSRKFSKRRKKAGTRNSSKEVIIISSDDEGQSEADTHRNLLQLEDALKKSKQETLIAKHAQEKAENEACRVEDALKKSEQETIEAKQAQEEAETKVASYNEELEAMRADTDQLKINASELHDDTTCDVCTTIMERPFVLPQCGHISCQGCIYEWFDTIRTDQWRRPFGRRYRPVYNCPTCQKIVMTEPVQVYKLKSITQKMGWIFAEDIVRGRSPNQDVRPWALFFPQGR